MSWKHLVGSAHISIFMTSSSRPQYTYQSNVSFEKYFHRSKWLKECFESKGHKDSPCFQKLVYDGVTYISKAVLAKPESFQEENIRLFLRHSWHTVAELVEATSGQHVQMSILRCDGQISFLCSLRVFVSLLTFPQSSCLDIFFFFYQP